MSDGASEAEINTDLSKEQKTGFVLLFIFAIIGLSLGVLQIRNTLLAPFALTNEMPATIKEQVNDESALILRDTDGDGVSDYDEEYVEGTSPYLYDTYGYGMSDGEVIIKGLARCAAAGKNCMDASTPMVSSTSATSSFSGEEIENFINAFQNPTELRKMLVQSGMDKALLDQVNDNELMTMVYQLVVSSTP